MTDQHPLTDEICAEIRRLKYVWHPKNMRAVADWQLEQAAKWWLNHLQDDGYSDITIDYVIKDFREAMRPTTTQENN
tara:strand:- start:678 stop:908 length:231 start_codon:yes stop_codon:yes gene_type:complete